MTTKVTPSLAELEATLGDDKQLANLMKDGRFGSFLKDYQDTKLENWKAENLQQLVDDQVKATLVDMLKENGATFRPGAGEPAKPTNKYYNAKAPGAGIDKHFSDSAEFFQAIWHHVDTLPDGPALRAKRTEAQKVQNSYGSQVPADGGFLIPEQLRSEILSVSLETAIVRPRARVIPMDTLRVPIPMIDSSSNASSVFGGIVAYWTEEGATLTESQAKFGRVVLEAKKLTAYAEIPNELLADAPAFRSFFGQLYPEAVAWYEDDAFINGTGVGMPLGFRQSGAKVTVTQAGGTPNIVFTDIAAMYARMLPSSLKRAVWIAHPSAFPALAAMEISAGSPATWINNLRDDAPMTLLGRPVIFTEKVPATGSAGQLSFVDLGFYLIGDRQTMQAASSEHYKFQNDVTSFRIVERVDGRPWLQSAITPKNGSDTLTPFVELGASQA